MGGWGYLLIRALAHLESRFPEGPRCCIGSLNLESVFFPTAADNFLEPRWSHVSQSSTWS